MLTCWTQVSSQYAFVRADVRQPGERVGDGLAVDVEFYAVSKPLIYRRGTRLDVVIERFRIDKKWIAVQVDCAGDHLPCACTNPAVRPLLQSPTACHPGAPGHRRRRKSQPAARR